VISAWRAKVFNMEFVRPEFYLYRVFVAPTDHEFGRE
jgi:hypothetical protein